MKFCSEWEIQQKSLWVGWLLDLNVQEDLHACFIAPGGSVSVQSFTWFVFCPVVVHAL